MLMGTLFVVIERPWVCRWRWCSS